MVEARVKVKDVYALWFPTVPLHRKTHEAYLSLG